LALDVHLEMEVDLLVEDELLGVHAELATAVVLAD